MRRCRFSGWAHGLIKEQSHLSFHLCAIVPRDAELELKYDLPSNVIGLTTIRLNDLPSGATLTGPLAHRMHRALREPLATLTSEKAMELGDLKRMMEVLNASHSNLGTDALLDREEAWAQLIELYEAAFPDHSFLDYFWSYRAIAGGVYSVLLANLPQADVYHAMSTGYAGLMAARAKASLSKPAAMPPACAWWPTRACKPLWWKAKTSNPSTTTPPSPASATAAEPPHAPPPGQS